MADKAQFVGRWVHWEGIFRIEQELFKNGSFKATIIDESENKVDATAKGRWEISVNAIRWRYTSAKNLPIPKRVDVNPILHVDENRFDVRENSRSISDWYRLVKSEETSTNFDYEELQPFLKRVATFISSGFGRAEIAALMKKVKKLKPEQTHEQVFSINFNGVVAPFRITVYMDDFDAPDAYFYAPVKLARQIHREIQKRM
jgi:hypothetical protein